MTSEKEALDSFRLSYDKIACSVIPFSRRQFLFNGFTLEKLRKARCELYVSFNEAKMKSFSLITFVL